MVGPMFTHTVRCSVIEPIQLRIAGISWRSCSAFLIELSKVPVCQRRRLVHILLHPGPFLFVPLSGVMRFQWTFQPEMHVVVDVWEYPQKGSHVHIYLPAFPILLIERKLD